jgi:lysine-N-methylase
LPNDPPFRLTYADSFRCIGSACEDTCCQGWTVPLDRATFEKYQSLPESPLRVLINASVVRKSPCAADPADAKGPADAADSVYATIRMNDANECPMFTADRLCGIQNEFGENMLSHACATYPRIVHSRGGVEEKALTLSCPEAARLVLLTPDLLVGEEKPGDRTSGAEARLDSATHSARLKSYPVTEPSQTPADFWAIRAVVLKVVRARIYPLWQRLFLLDLLCRRLDSIARGELERSVPAVLADFEATVATGALKPALETLPADLTAQLDVVLRLAGMMLHKSNVRPRFVECVQAFTAGIGNGPGATLETLAANYARAHDRCYAALFDRHPHIMENFLINTIVRCQFPFGKEGMKAGEQPNKTREFAQLAAQFALTRGLLIGVAGHHGAAFADPHVVHTVQAASKHFEHHPEFLSMAYELLRESGMDGARGMAILLRDAELRTAEFRTAETVRACGEATPASPARSAPEQPDERSAWPPLAVRQPAPQGTGRRE